MFGIPTDDNRWIQVVLDHFKAIAVGVTHRLALENSFPTAVEDDIDATLYLIEKAHELVIDVSRIVTSGPAGGSLAIIVPLRWQEELCEKKLRAEPYPGNTSTAAGRSSAIVTWYSSTDFTISRDEHGAMCL